MFRYLTLLWSAQEVDKTEFIETNSPASEDTTATSEKEMMRSPGLSEPETS